MFKIRGRSENFGRIFALITLRARTSDTALTQEAISRILSFNFPNSPVSVSTTFRSLTYLCENRYCDYREGYYKKREYFLVQHNITGLSVQRIKYQQDLVFQFLEELNEIKTKIMERGINDSNNILSLLNQFIDEYEVIGEIYKEFLIRIQKELGDLRERRYLKSP